MPGEPTMVLNIRLPVDLKAAVEAAVRENQGTGQEPRTLTRAVTEALRAWLDARGTSLPAEEAVQSVRAPGRPKKPPYTLPEGTDAVALWREFWTIAHTKTWPSAAQWAMAQSGTTIGGWYQAMHAALPEDMRRNLTREEVGLVSEKEWIEQQVAGIMQPKPGKKEQP